MWRGELLDRAQGVVRCPGPQRLVQGHGAMDRIAGEDGAAAAFDHEVPHGRERKLKALEVGRTPPVGSEMKDPAADAEQASLGLEIDHRGLRDRDLAEPEMAERCQQRREAGGNIV